MHCETLLRLSIEEVNLKNWGVTVDPSLQQNGKNISGGWHSELGGGL